MASVNLIPAPRRRAAAARAHMVKWVTALAVYAALLLATAILCGAYAGGDGPALAEESRRLSARLRRSNLALLALHRKLAETRRKLQSAREVGKQPDWGVLLAVLAENLSDQVVLDRCRLRREEKPDADRTRHQAPAQGRLVLALSGIARSQAAVSGFVLRLEQTGLFSRVTMVKTSRRPFLTGKAVAFELECVVEATAGP